jgi:hypothetical protein
MTQSLRRSESSPTGGAMSVRPRRGRAGSQQEMTLMGVPGESDSAPGGSDVSAPG